MTEVWSMPCAVKCSSCADKDNRIAELEAKHTALVDGLRELMTEMRDHSYKTTNEYTDLHGFADELRALLGDEDGKTEEAFN